MTDIVERLDPVARFCEVAGRTKDGHAIRDAMDQLTRDAAEIVRLRGEVAAMETCAVKYLGWLGVKDAAAGLRKDMADPEMVERPIAPAEAKGDGLWCLHILGPDDVHAAPSKAHAEKAAEKLNAFMAARTDKHPLDPDCQAVAAPWPHSAESHAEDVGEFIERWLLPSGQVQALAKLTPQSADGEAVALVALVEGPSGHRWTNGYGLRLKDTPEWVAFYVATKNTTPPAAQVQQISAGDAVFAFSAMLTSLPHVVPFGAAAWATPGVELATAFNAANGLTVSRDFPGGIKFAAIEGELLDTVKRASEPEDAHPSACELGADAFDRWWTENRRAGWAGNSKARRAAHMAWTAALQHRGDSQEVGRG